MHFLVKGILQKDNNMESETADTGGKKNKTNESPIKAKTLL